MTVEISPEKYWVDLNYHDAILYCQLLLFDDKNDWRLPDSWELSELFCDGKLQIEAQYWSNTFYSIPEYVYGWRNFGSDIFKIDDIIKTIPVRDV